MLFEKQTTRSRKDFMNSPSWRYYLQIIFFSIVFVCSSGKEYFEYFFKVLKIQSQYNNKSKHEQQCNYNFFK